MGSESCQHTSLISHFKMVCVDRGQQMTAHTRTNKPEHGMGVLRWYQGLDEPPLISNPQSIGNMAMLATYHQSRH